MAGRKRKEDVEEGSPEWMNTYGDMVTLLLTFFVLLFSFSTLDAQKWEQLVNALSGTSDAAMGIVESEEDMLPEEIENIVLNLPAATPPAPTENMNAAEVAERFDELYQKIRDHIQKNDLGYILYVEKQDETILLRLRDSALFDSAKADIKKDAEIILVDVCDILQEYYEYIKMVRIEGYTDNRPISTVKYASNWELSIARAVEVLQYMAKNTNIDETKFSIAGFGEFHPIASNDTEEGRAQNRRVDFVIESKIIDLKS